MREPITTVAQLEKLDSDEIVEGYNDARHGEPAPGDNRSLSYWHGWRNGAIDSYRMPPDAAAHALARDCIRTGYFRRLKP